MTTTPDEKLFDYLSEIDDGFLQEAMELDAAEKLPNQEKIKPFTQQPVFRWSAIIAACLAILLCVSLLLQNIAPLTGGEQPNTPPQLYDPTWGTHPTEPSEIPNPTIPNESLDPPWLSVGTNLSIESADMLNYYSAIYLLAQQATGTGASSSSFLLWDPADMTDPPYGDEPYCTMPPPPWEMESEYPEPPADTEPGISKDIYEVPPAEPGMDFDTDTTYGPPPAPSTEYTIPEDAEIVYYDFDPNATFHLNNVIFFRIQLSGNGFLAQALGTGIVDVVITDLGICERMITLKNGDKYLSCLINGGSDTFFEFSTHKYIDGFSIVKNFRQENYAFVVTLDGNMQADHFECQIFGYGNNPDGIVPIVGETYIADTNLTFTITELEAYFQSFKTPN